VKEKVLAAHRFGLKTVILPKRNEPDLEDVPDEIREKMKFVFVETVDEALDAALQKRASRKRGTTKKSNRAR
jgi:ATP-dependent Lon protease